jgi:hypothetical protein
MNEREPQEREFLPAGFAPEAGVPRDSPQFVSRLCAHLRAAGARLARERSVDAIIDAFDAVAAVWLDRLAAGDAVVARIAAHTRLSPAMVEACIRAEQTSSRAGDVREALDGELGDRRALDGFVWQAAGRRHLRAFGPELVLGILPGNIPGLSHLPLMRSLLVKAPFLGKSASGEPFYAAAYARALAEVDPLLGDAVAILDWRREDDALLGAALDAADAVIAYGSQVSVEAIAARARPGQRVALHGHKLGVAIVVAAEIRERLDEVCRGLAMDVAMYDQQACLAPQRLLVVGDESDTREVAASLAAALAALHEQLPRATTDLAEAAGLRAWRDALEWAGGTVHADGPWGAVAETGVDASAAPTQGWRSAWKPFLQNAAVAAAPATFARLAETLAALGCSRIVAAGAMPFPSFRWHHDGRACLAELVRFADIEGAAEAPLDDPLF